MKAVPDADSSARRQQLLEALLAWSEEKLTWEIQEKIFDRVMRATLVDALRTGRAAAILTAAGYGREALKLGRSLLESVIVSCWATHCAESEDWVVDRMRDHDRLNRAITLEKIHEHDWPIPDISDDPIAEIADDRERLQAQFGNYGETSWWAREIEAKPSGGWKITKQRRLGLLVDELLEVPGLEGVVWDRLPGSDGDDGEISAPIKSMEVIPQRLNNQFLHHNPTGLASFVEVVDDEIVFKIGPSDDWLPQAQMFLYQCLATLVEFMVERHRPDLADEFRSRFNPMFHQAYVELTDEQLAWAKNNRNKPCPCLSGLKSKRCHAA